VCILLALLQRAKLNHSGSGCYELPKYSNPEQKHGNTCKLFFVMKSCSPKRWLLSNRGSIDDSVTSRMCLPQRRLSIYCSSLLSRKHVSTIRCLAMDYSVTIYSHCAQCNNNNNNNNNNITGIIMCIWLKKQKQDEKHRLHKN
jgi:hypothetical protein